MVATRGQRKSNNEARQVFTPIRTSVEDPLPDELMVLYLSDVEATPVKERQIPPIKKSTKIRRKKPSLAEPTTGADLPETPSSTRKTRSKAKVIQKGTPTIPTPLMSIPPSPKAIPKTNVNVPVVPTTTESDPVSFPPPTFPFLEDPPYIPAPEESFPIPPTTIPSTGEKEGLTRRQTSGFGPYPPPRAPRRSEDEELAKVKRALAYSQDRIQDLEDMLATQAEKNKRQPESADNGRLLSICMNMLHTVRSVNVGVVKGLDTAFKQSRILFVKENEAIDNLLRKMCAVNPHLRKDLGR